MRYVDCDPMNVVHHSVYPVWLEVARTQLLREQGVVYRDLAAKGVHFVVARMNLRYRRPARYDEELTIHVEVARCAGVKVEHRYEVRRGEELLVTGEATLACVNAEGKVRPVPAELLMD